MREETRGSICAWMHQEFRTLIFWTRPEKLLIACLNPVDSVTEFQGVFGCNSKGREVFFEYFLELEGSTLRRSDLPVTKRIDSWETEMSVIRIVIILMLSCVTVAAQ